MKPWPLHLAWILLGCHGTFGMAQSKAEPAHIEVVQPLRHQVFQRRFDVPQLSHPHHPGGPAKGFAEVDCVLMLEHNSEHNIQFRIRQSLDEPLNEIPWKQARLF